MNKRRILIVDYDQKNLKVLEMNFQASSYMVATASSNEEALCLITQNTFDIILTEITAASIDGYQLLKEVQRNPNHDLCHVIFLSIKSDVWNRVKSLKLGAKDYIVKPVHVSEIVARVNMVQNRIESNYERQTTNSNTFTGRLEDLAVIDLIEILGSEKKTGILSLNNENGHSGQIVFNRGSVIRAAAESLRAEEAIYKMIYWNRGRFSMLFTEVHVDDEFTLSNMGLLLQGAKRMDLRNELLKQLPSLDAVVITTSNFKKIIAQKDIHVELREFMTLFDGERSLGRIIDDSHENEIVTLKRIVKLYKLGFLHVLRDFSSEQPVQFRADHEEEFSEFVPLEEESLSEEDFDEMDESSMDMDHEIDKVVPDNFPRSETPAKRFMPEANQSKKRTNDVFFTAATMDEKASSLSAAKVNLQENMDPKTHILMMSVENHVNNAFVKSLVSRDPEEIFVHTVQSPIYHGQVNFRGGTQLQIVGINPNEQYSMLLDYFKEKTIGCIFYLNLDTINWSYHRYLLKMLSRRLMVPILVIGRQSRTNSDFESQEVRDKLDLDESFILRFISQVDVDNCRRVLFTLLNEVQGKSHLSLQAESESAATK